MTKFEIFPQTQLCEVYSSIKIGSHNFKCEGIYIPKLVLRSSAFSGLELSSKAVIDNFEREKSLPLITYGNLLKQKIMRAGNPYRTRVRID